MRGLRRRWGINLKQIRYFVKVVEAGNITKAAEQLNVAQTALGLQIRSLENAMKVSLFDRHSRGVEPTEAGKFLFERALVILRMIGDTERDLRNYTGRKTREIRIGVTPSIMHLIGPDLMLVARKEYPELSVQLVEGLSFSLLDSFSHENIDIALAYEAPNNPMLHRQALLREDLLFISSARQGRVKPTVSFETAARSPLTMISNRDSIWGVVHNAASQLNVDVNVQFQVESVDAVRTLARRGIAHSIVPYGVVRDELAAGEIVGQRIVDPAIQRTLYFVRHADKALEEENLVMQLVQRGVSLLLATLGENGHLMPQRPPASLLWDIDLTGR